MAAELCAANVPTSAAEAEEVLCLSVVLTGEDIGAIAGALSMLTSFVTAEVPDILARQRELTRWFRCLAKSTLSLGETITVRSDERCLTVWAKAAEAVRQRALAALPDIERGAALAARSAIYAAEVTALREHLGVWNDEEI
jgi:hypothetical protein